MKNTLEKFISTPYREWFEVLPATTDELKEESFKIRHQVYCNELKYEDVNESGLEFDEYDNDSLHILIRHRTLNKFIGSVRLIVTDQTPMFSHFNESDILFKQENKKIAEISRLSVLREFRNRKGEEKTSEGVSDNSFLDRRSDIKRKEKGIGSRFPYIPLGLYMGLISWSIYEDITDLVLLSEPRLANHFSKLGVKVSQIGPEIDYRGIRAPFHIDVSAVIPDMRRIFKPLYREVNSQFLSYLPIQSHDKVRV